MEKEFDYLVKNLFPIIEKFNKERIFLNKNHESIDKKVIETHLRYQKYLKEIAIIFKKLSITKIKDPTGTKFNPIKHKNLYKNHTSYLKNNIKLLHCTTEYPAPLQELNLNVIKLFKKKYPVDIGYSDHSHNLITPIIATTMLASIIEVHITLDNQMDGPDHKSSLNMNMLKKYITNISDTITILGLGEKKITVSESKNSRVVKKYLYYSRDVQKGEILLDDMILCKRSNKGISSTEYHKVLGKPLTISKKGHTRISHNHFMNKI